jgi:hypothetical protein
MSENEEPKLELKNSRTELSNKANESVRYWDAILANLTVRVREVSLKDIVDVQTEGINYRQIVSGEVKTYSVKIHKLVQKMKVLQKSKFEFYSTSYQVKTNGTEKLRLIESDLSEIQCFINELDEHVNYLRDTSKNLENLNYAVKNRIELANILGI